MAIGTDKRTPHVPKGIKTAQKVTPLLGSGIQLTVTVLAFGALGWWLDGRFGTEPWLLLSGLIFGMVGGMISFIRTALQAGNSGTARTATTTKRGDHQDRNDEHSA